MKSRQGFTSFIILTLLFTFVSADLFSQKWKRYISKENPTFSEIRKGFYENWEKDPIKRFGRWKQFKRWEWFAQDRLDKTGRFDPALHWNGWLEKKERFNAANKNIVQNVTWTELGPVRKPEEYHGNGYPGMGRLNCIAFHPHNPAVIYVGSASGGLWKTNNDGNNWTNLTDNLPNLGVTSVLIHPTNPGTMYMATGDADGYDTFSFGVLKSLDGGQSWHNTGFTAAFSDFLAVAKLMFHPSNPEIIYAAARNGIYKSVNGGGTWVLKRAGQFKDIEVHPTDSTIWFATGFGTGIFRSTDSGETWSQVSNGLPTGGFSRVALEFAPSAPHILYALYVKANDEGYYGLYRSDDTGSTWALKSNSPNILGWTRDGTDIGGQGDYDLTLNIHPSRPNTVFIGGINFWRSTDGGGTWTILAHWNGHRATLLHADQHGFKFHPTNPDIAYIANDGGIFKTQDGGENWTDLSSGLAIHQVYRLGLSESDPNRFLIGNQDNGSDFYLNGTWNAVYGGDGMECAIDPVYNNIMYCSIYNGSFYKSENNAETWTAIGSEFTRDGAWVTPFLQGEEAPGVLYVATDHVYRSTDRGENWAVISPFLPNNARPMRSLAVSSDGTHLYTANRVEFFVSRNSGSSWSSVTGDTVPLGITYLSVHPTNSRKLWATTRGYFEGYKVFTSNDAGQTWVNISGTLPNIPVHCIVIDRFTESLYIGTDLGVFYMSPAKSGWEALPNGLPNVIVTELEIHYATGKIRAATYGRGIWEAPLVEQPAVFPPLSISGERQENRSMMSTELIDLLTWNHNPKNTQGLVSQYRIYKWTPSGQTLVDTVDAGATQYYVRRATGEENIYAVTAVTGSGTESSRARAGIR